MSSSERREEWESPLFFFQINATPFHPLAPQLQQSLEGRRAEPVLRKRVRRERKVAQRMANRPERKNVNNVETGRVVGGEGEGGLLRFRVKKGEGGRGEKVMSRSRDFFRFSSIERKK